MVKSTVLKTRWLPLVLILGVYLPLVLWYSVTVPIFEGPDESSHYKVAYGLLSTGHLPVLNYAVSGEEEHQPPLYYALVASVLRLVDAGAADGFMLRNPHAGISAVDSLGNKNAFLHGDPAERWPFRDVPLAVHMARLVSMAFGVLTVVATYGIGIGVFGRTRPGLAAAPAAVVAFTPQFVFISGAINNDSAVAAFSALVLWLVIAYGNKPRSYRWLIALGVAGGLASLSKAAGLASIGLIVAGLIAKAIRNQQLARIWQEILVVLAVSALVGGWWFARNWALYDDPLLSRYITRWFGANAVSADAMLVLQRFWQGLPSYWGVFGWLNIGWPEWIYQLLRLASVAAGLGIVVFLVRLLKGKERETNLYAIGLVALWTALTLAAIGRWIAIAGGLQGRLLFPAISSLSVLMVLGWSSLVPTAWRARAMALPIAGLLGLALVTPLAVIAPAYAPPKLLSLEQVPDDMIPTSLTIGDHAELIGYRTEPSPARPNETVKIILYWHVLKPADHDYSVFVTLLGRDLEEIGSINTYPGLGNLRTSQWPVGKVIEDVYSIHVAPNAQAPVLAAISTGWYDYYHRYVITQTDPQGNETSFVGSMKLVPLTWPQAPRATLANFADQIRLAGYTVNRPDEHTMNLSLKWISQARPDRDLTIFVHVVDAQGTILAQKDQAPLAGDYPTSAWEPGEVVLDHIDVPLPDGWIWSQAQGIEIGLYDPKTGERLSVLDKSGQVAGNSVTLRIPAQ